MSTWATILFFSANVLVLSFLLAIFEILLERQYGWGGRLNPQGWGKQLFAGTLVSRVCEKQYLTPYHIIMFGVVVPCILIAQVSSAKAAGLISSWQGTQTTLFLVATWFSLLGVEDALWFVFNWYYPDSWTDLLSGNIWWHTRWINIGSVKLPRFYLTTQLLAIVFLIACIRRGGILPWK